MEVALDVVGIGNAIVDVLAFVDESFIAEHGLEKGRMTLIDADRADDLYGRMPKSMEMSGGAAANTTVGVAALGGRAGYIGKVANDNLGRVFRRDLLAGGVSFDVADGLDLPTACCLIQVTPDAQRTMNTHLGVSAYLSPDDIDTGFVASAKILYCEGYLWDTDEAKAAIRQAMGVAHNAGRMVALSLSDVFCVDRHRGEWLELLDGFVDVIFGNEQEVCALSETAKLSKALDAVAPRVNLVFTTVGARGSVVADGSQRLSLPAVPVEQVIDTTGAGDLYASGVLFGLSHGLPLEEVVRLGGAAASATISHLGARPEINLAELADDLRS